MLEICAKVNSLSDLNVICESFKNPFCLQAREQWPILTMIMQHKLGACPISDVSIAIIVSSVHRKESLAAVNYAINELKEKVPIWKKVFTLAASANPVNMHPHRV